MQAATTSTGSGSKDHGLFPDYLADEALVTSAWLERRLREIRGEQLLELVRVLDKTMNNTSLILLFAVGSRKLLFPGDATPLLIGKSQPSPGELAAQYAIFLKEICNHVLLALIHPTGK